MLCYTIVCYVLQYFTKKFRVKYWYKGLVQSAILAQKVYSESLVQSATLAQQVYRKTLVQKVQSAILAQKVYSEILVQKVQSAVVAQKVYSERNTGTKSLHLLQINSTPTIYRGSRGQEYVMPA